MNQMTVPIVKDIIDCDNRPAFDIETSIYTLASGMIFIKYVNSKNIGKSAHLDCLWEQVIERAVNIG